MASALGLFGVLCGILGEALRLAALGIALGYLASLAAARVLASQIQGVSLSDAATHLGVAGIVLAVSLLAAFIPAWRASRVHPMVALRQSS